MIPGSDILAMALTVIDATTVRLYEFTGRSTTAAGMRVATFADPVDIVGSLQPVPRAMYQQLGLDFNKNYVTFYSSKSIKDVTRDRTGDQLEYDGKRWQVESSNDWLSVDGWNGVLCVQVPAP